MKKIKFDENWIPITEDNKFDDSGFDKRFPIDRIYLIEDEPNEKLTKQKKTRIRFVKHPDCKVNEIRVYRTDMMIYLPIFEKGVDNKIIESSEKVMTIEKAEKKYGIKLNTH
jgi:ribosomal protein S8